MYNMLFYLVDLPLLEDQENLWIKKPNKKEKRGYHGTDPR